jgi:hypothetical protein
MAPTALGSACAALVAALAAGCANPLAPDDAAVCSAYRAGRSHVEVVADGRVTRVLGLRSGRVSSHEGFLMRLRSGCNLVVRVEANAAFTGAIPLRRGDRVLVKGEYEYYPLGGVIHWTHRAIGGRHEGGFVDVRGRMYD